MDENRVDDITWTPPTAAIVYYKRAGQITSLMVVPGDSIFFRGVDQRGQELLERIQQERRAPYLLCDSDRGTLRAVERLARSNDDPRGPGFKYLT